jgi:hypothetical protein
VEEGAGAALGAELAEDGEGAVGGGGVLDFVFGSWIWGIMGGKGLGTF